MSTASRSSKQIVRPTGLVDPAIEVRATEGQIDDLIAEINKRVDVHERVLVTTPHQAHGRGPRRVPGRDRRQGSLPPLGNRHPGNASKILSDLRRGVYDVVVGINLLREGLDLPEVSLVAILDADKEGFLRSETSLIQTIGRAARHLHGRVIMYADLVTHSMKRAIDETYRRRSLQVVYNEQHGITPASIVKSLRDLTERVAQESGHDGLAQAAEESPAYDIGFRRTNDLSRVELAQTIKDLERQMRLAADSLAFEKAAALRDQISDLRQDLEKAKA